MLSFWKKLTIPTTLKNLEPITGATASGYKFLIYSIATQFLKKYFAQSCFTYNKKLQNNYKKNKKKYIFSSSALLK